MTVRHYSTSVDRQDKIEGVSGFFLRLYPCKKRTRREVDESQGLEGEPLRPVYNQVCHVRT